VYICDVKSTEGGERELTVKLGDFSCSATILYDNDDHDDHDKATRKERKRSSICGTKEYFSPGMLSRFDCMYVRNH